MKIRNKMVHTFFLLIFLLCQTLIGQTKTRVEGKVTDEKGNPLAYVNVFLLNTTDGAMSDEDGNFSFFTYEKGKKELTASIVGYEKFQQEIELTGENLNVDIRLIEKAVILKEAIITGSSYGSEKAKGLVVNRLDILTTPGGAADIFQALKTLPGLTQVSESAELYIRGGDPIESLTMIDGAVVYHPYTFESAYGGIFSNLNQSAVKGMYFSSGGFSAKYGNALSGVLDIETRNQPANYKYQLGLSLANASLSVDFTIEKEKLGLYFDIRQSFTKPIFWLNGGGDRLVAAPASKMVPAELFTPTHKPAD